MASSPAKRDLADTPPIIESVVYQHAENVCSLWMLREQAVDEPHYSFADLLHLDDRLEANIDGLRIAGPPADPMLEEMLAAGDEGARFGLAVLALERGERETFARLVADGAEDAQGQAELGSALAWVEPRHLGGHVKALLDSTADAEIVVGLDACAAHGRSPGARLERLLHHSNAAVRAAACHTAADLGERAFVTALDDTAVETEDDEERFARARAFALLGRAERARAALESLALGDSPRSGDAVALLMAMSESRTGRVLLKRLDALPGRERDVVAGFGLLGDPVAMPWLIGRCDDPALARLAGGAMTMITGIDLAYEDLDLDDVPEGAEAGPNDDPTDENVAMDHDENLPWPDPECVSGWWQGRKSEFVEGTLYLDGRLKRPSEFKHTFAVGMQRQRSAAALALALASPEVRYQDTRLPTVRQRAWVEAV